MSLAAAGIGDGHCAFEVMLPSAMLDGDARMLSLHHRRTGLAVDGSPKLFNPPRIRGRLGGCIRLVVEGWAVDDVAPETPVILRLEIDGRFVQLITADQFREDLAAKLGGKGNNAFRAAMPSEVFDGQPHRVAVHAVNGGDATAELGQQTSAAGDLAA